MDNLLLRFLLSYVLNTVVTTIGEQNLYRGVSSFHFLMSFIQMGEGGLEEY